MEQAVKAFVNMLKSEDFNCGMLDSEEMAEASKKMFNEYLDNMLDADTSEECSQALGLGLMAVMFPLMIKTFDGTVDQKEMEKHLENIEKIVESELMD